MKKRINFFARVLVLVVMIMLLMPQEIWGQKWTQSGSTWYIHKGTLSNSDGSSNTGNISVYMPNTNATCSISWSAEKSKFFVTGNVNFFVEAPSGTNRYSESVKTDSKKTGSNNNTTIPNKCTTIKYGWSGTSVTNKSITISIPVPKHTDINTSGTTTSYTFDDAAINGTTTKNIDFAQFFKSFYTNNAITATIIGTNAQYFHLPNNAQSITIANAGSVYASASCFTEGSGVGSLNTSNATVSFTPTAAGDFTATLRITYDGGTKDIELKGKGTAKNATFDWKTDDLAVGEGKEFSEVVGINEQDVNQTGLTIEETNSDGTTPLTESAKLNISGTTITGLAEGTTYIKATFTFGNTNYKSPASEEHELTVSLNELAEREIVWNADFTSLRDNSPAIDLSSDGWKATWQATTPAASGDVVNYVIADPSIASISGNILTIHKEGVTSITATVDADATYKKATMTKPLVVSSSTGCNTIMVNQAPNTTSDYTSPEFNGRPKKVMWTISTNDNDDAAGTVYLKKTDGTTISSQTIAKNTNKTYTFDVPSNYQDIRQFKVTGLTSGGILLWAYNRTLTSFQVIMASYLEPIANNSISFGEHDNFSESTLIPNIANYANLPGNINVEIVDVETGGNNTWDCFKFSDNTHATSVTTGGCGVNNQGTASITIKFVPKQMGEHKARLKVSAYDGNSENPVTFYIPITGSGKKVTQNLTWDNEHNIFTGTYNALSGNVALTDAASTDGINVGGELTMGYSSSNTAVADVVTNGDIQYIDFKTAGTFRLRANCAGNNVYSDAAQIESGDITVNPVTPELHWTTTPDNSTNVFQTLTIGAATNDTEGTIGNISYSVTPANAGSVTGNQLTLNNCVETTISAKISATEIYSEKTITHKFTPAKVTPNLNCSITSLNKTALTNLNFTEMPVTITNLTTLWHDVAVTYSSSDESIAKLDGDHFQLLKSGSCTITAEVVEGANNNASSNKIQIALTVVKASQNIIWNLSDEERATHYDGDVITLTAECSANNITYTSSNDNIATVNDGRLTFHRPGTVTITARSATTDVYESAEDVEKVFSAKMLFGETYIGQAATSTNDIDLSDLEGATTLTLTSSNPTVFRAFTDDEASTNTSLNNQINITGAGRVNVKFYPETVGEVTGTITITGNNSKSISIEVVGTGVKQSVVFGSADARIARGTIESRTIELTNMVSSAGYTITSDDVQFVVTQPANGEFTVAFLPQNNTDIAGHTITIHDNAFGLKTTNDYKIEISGYANAVEEFNFGNADARTTSPTTKQITLIGLNNIPGLKISSDDMNTYMVDGKSAAFAPTDGQHTISFNPFHKGQYNDKEIYLYATGANNTIVKYPLIKCDGQGSQVDLSGEINWVNTTIATMDPVTGMAAINNQTYNSYIRLYYTVNTVSSGDFYDYSNAPTGFTVDSSQILALSAGSANIIVHVETLDGSDDFTGQSSADITATDKKIQKISYSNNIHYVVLNEDITVNVYAYDSKDPSTHIDADITMTSADSKVTISKGTYDATNFVQPFTIRGNVSGNTKVTITSTPKDAESEYESATLTDIPVTILANGDNCIVSVLNNPNNNTFNTSGTGGETTFALTGAPCRKFTATLNYNFGTPTLNISDGTNTLVNTTYSSAIGSSSKDITYTYSKTSKNKPTNLKVKITGTSGIEGDKSLTITEYSQLSYFDVISNHPNNSTIDFGTHTIGTTSVNETIKVDYSALHKAVELTLNDETNFTIVNKSAVMGAIHDCSQWGNLDIIIKYNPTTYGTHNATLTIEGYTTDDNNSESVKTYTYTLTGQGKKRVQTISWKTAESYSIFDIGSTLTLEAESSQPEYGKTTKMPITYTLDNDGGGVATLSGNVLTIAKGGKITVTAHQAGDEYTEAATDETLDITIDATLHFVATQDNRWDNGNNWSPGGIIPTNEYNASIESPCTIESHSECLSLTITESGSLTVNADAVLEVAGTLTNDAAERLTLKADENNSATVLFAEGSPKATVESYIKGTINPNDVPIAGKNNPAWQYRGFAGENPVLSGWDVVILRWNETQNSTNCWETTPPAYNRSGNFSNGEPWDGYSMANYNTDNHIYAYTSTLIPTSQSHTYLLSYTGAQETPNRGVNLITNSWSAPVDMTSNSVTFSGNVEETFYFFNTRSHLEWENDKDGSFVVYPKATGEAIYAGAISNKIASSQSFLIKAKGTGAKLTIGNEALAKEASGAMYAPREKEHFNILTITMSIDDVEDQLFLVESDKCSSSFDNGYDGTKIRESNRPQIFVINDFGYTAVNATNSILGQTIGYSASAEGALCTISFNAERLEGYSELYLLDRVTRKYTNILAGESYIFTGKHSEESERFEIVGRRDDGTEFVVSEKEMIEVIGNYALLSGFKETNEMVYITDLFGRHLWTEHSSNGPMFELPDLPAGVYIIHCGSVNCKFVVK